MTSKLDVRELATEKGISLRALSEAAGIPYGSISRVLNGGSCRPDWRDAIAKVLAVEPVALDLKIAAGRVPPAEPVELDGTPRLLIGLFERLPPAGVWPEAERKEWLSLAEHIFRVLYREPPAHDQST
jgi:transcriptional regulator with XRE-family HTH domain